jgi:hypothetical protein
MAMITFGSAGTTTSVSTGGNEHGGDG